VADTAHFGRAAERLRVAQSGLSQQIKKLERSVGATLFVRDQRHVELTEAGRVFIDHARLVLEMAERAKESVNLAGRGKVGVLKVATMAAGLQPVTARVLDAFRDRYPDAELELHPAFSIPNVEALSRRRVDLAIVNRPVELPASATYLHLGGFEIMVAMSESHRLASLPRLPRAELLHDRFVTIPRSLHPALVDHIHEGLFGDLGRPPFVSIIDVASDVRLSTVANDPDLLGVGFGPDAHLRIPGLVLRSVEDPTPRVEFGVVWFPDHPSPFLQPFISLARELAEPSSGASEAALERR
jgi:DNA-binding transcriptional LysR family regulator